MFILHNAMLRSALVTAFILAILVALLMVQVHQLAPLYKETTLLVQFVGLFAVSVFIGVLAACFQFYKNRKHPKIKVSTARWQYALLATFLPMLVFFLGSWLMGLNDAACLSGNLYAVVADPANAAVCLNIKSLLLTKLLGFMSPAFIGQLLVTMLLVGFWSLLLYWLLTMRVMYQNDH